MKIAIATTTRADWGLLSPLARELRERGAQVDVLASAAHYNPSLGLTVSEIEADGFAPKALSKEQGNPAIIAADCLKSYSEWLAENRPDCLVCLGDRYEMLAIAQGSVLAGVPVIHIAGGAISEGAYDDSFRHAITKLAHLHLTECEQYRQRVISMGENPATVFSTGALGIYNMLHIPRMSASELRENLDFDVDSDTLICTMHAATLEPDLSPAQQYDILLQALEEELEQSPRLKVLFSYPNNDVDPLPLIEKIEAFSKRHICRVKALPSLGIRRYVSALALAGGVIGNSSSGIVEVPSMGIPVLDIGVRQRGRMHGPGVLHAPCTVAGIRLGIHQILSLSHKALAAKAENPYAQPETPKRMADIILSTHFHPHMQKSFHS